MIQVTRVCLDTLERGFEPVFIHYGEPTEEPVIYNQMLRENEAPTHREET